MDLQGVLAPIPTPFDTDEQVDVPRLRAAVDRWAASPLSGIVVLGSTGEAVFLDEHESEAIVAAARERWPKDRQFVVGTGRESTAAAIRAARRAADLGADAVLVRTPGFYKAQMTAEAFVRHYTAVADASPVPVLLYNFTAVTGVNIPLAAVSTLATHGNIAGIKESGSDVAQIADFVNGSPSRFHVMAGSATTFYSALTVGARGGILALSCVAPEACVRVYDLATSGRHDEALACQRRLLPLAKLLGSTHGVAGLKAAMAFAGFDVGGPRAPLAKVPDAAATAIRDALASLVAPSAADRQLTTSH
jgi:4-hydroxy-2-oxoglutarate aldolase